MGVLVPAFQLEYFSWHSELYIRPSDDVQVNLYGVKWFSKVCHLCHFGGFERIHRWPAYTVSLYVNLSVIRNYKYNNGCVATRKFQTVIQLVEKKWRLSGQKVILLVMRISANVQYDTKTIQLSWRPTYGS